MYRYDGEWPPPTITEWIRGGAVNTEHLAIELEFWLDWCGEQDEIDDKIVELIKEKVTPERFLLVWNKVQNKTE